MKGVGFAQREKLLEKYVGAIIPGGDNFMVALPSQAMRMGRGEDGWCLR
jgi:hypothetical protein